MNNEQQPTPNDLDSLVGDNHLQMMKAALPYMDVSEQRFISLFVKFHELRRTVHLFEDEEVAAMGICSAGGTKKTASPLEMLETIKPYASPAEQDFIDLIANFFQGFKLAGFASGIMPDSTVKDTKTTDNPDGQNPEKPDAHRQESRNSRPFTNPMSRMSMEQIKNFMQPEQQSRFETMQMMMSAMQPGS